MKSVRLTLLCMVAAVLSACSTPFCNAPGGLCSPQAANTSLPPPPPPPKPAPLPKPPPEPALPAAQTFAINLPDAPGSTGISDDDRGQLPPRAEPPAIDRTDNDAGQPSTAPIRIGLLLPLQSETLGAAADSVRAGFMAAWERDRGNITVTVLETGDVPQDILSVYARALQSEDLVVGPLSRSAVATIATSALVSKPTIALNYPEGYGQAGATPLPPHMLAIGLSIEEEARQAAQWAAREQADGAAVVLTTSSPWQRRVANAFAAEWQRLGRPVRVMELNAPDSYLSDPDLVQLRASLRQSPPALLFSAMGADQTRQLRIALGGNVSPEATNPTFSTADALPPPPPATPAESFRGLPIYGTSALNPGREAGFPTQDLEGVRLLDLPWQVQRDHPAVMVYPRPLQAGVGGADMARLYALGIDAFRVAREIGRHPVGHFRLDGVTGRLSIDFGRGPASFERIEPAAVYLNGAPEPVNP
ncbi:ABC transporter substrate-binding protein [Duganella sp. FT50W]|uniref:ABC transporter substrate-binding protein n=1 Tax=Duganella lactea TaxID=2692173 RepID=A0A6L8MDY4_9BURK|nr:penicillin-binding protein activator [Duganella lactea]MYM80614.1 ABC transporter substrate-binding protein [Duganella lactea]